MPLPDPGEIVRHARQKSTAFTAMYKEVTEISVPQPPRPVYLRPSSFPVCSILLLEQLLHPREEEWGYASDFFTGVGTQVHSIVERWAGRTNGRLWGNWKCHRGHHWHHTDNQICPECNGKGSYEEITIEYLGVKGHIDCILITDTGVLVGDYKTSTKYGVDKPTYSQHNMAYPLQISTYAYMLHRVWGKHFWHHYGKRVEGCSLLFISRDNPFRYREFTWHSDSALKFGKQTIRGAVVAWRAALRSIARGTTDAAIRVKSCKQPEDYDGRVSKFFTYAPCPMNDICFRKRLLDKHFGGTLAANKIGDSAAPKRKASTKHLDKPNAIKRSR